MIWSWLLADEWNVPWQDRQRLLGLSNAKHALKQLGQTGWPVRSNLPWGGLAVTDVLNVIRARTVAGQMAREMCLLRRIVAVDFVQSLLGNQKFVFGKWVGPDYQMEAWNVKLSGACIFNAESMVLLSLLLLLLLSPGVTTLVQTCASLVLTRCLIESKCANTLNLFTNL